MIEKIFNFKREIGIKSENYAIKLEIKKYGSKLKRWSSVIIEQRDKQKINSKAFAIPILTAI